MGNQKDETIRIVRGQDRYAGAPSKNSSIKIGLEESNRSKIDNDRNIIINLNERFDHERDISKKYRLIGKISNVFSNFISGSTEYDVFRNNLYYEDLGNQNDTWKGYPQYDEFSFIRTKGLSGHVDFQPKDMGNYNWMLYVTYANDKDYNQNMTYSFKNGDDIISNNFIVSDGIPYYTKKIKYNGKNVILFYCAYNHNLRRGDWVQLKNVVAGKRNFEVYMIGDLSYGNEDKVFGIYDYGYQDEHFESYEVGCVKRIGDINNIEETISEYYVRTHKTLSEQKNVDVTKMGFENINFPKESQIQRASWTPDGIEKVAVKNGTQTVAFSFDKDIDISGLVDNNGLPVTELFITVLHRGYMGFFYHPPSQRNATTRLGWEFNFMEDDIDPWWLFTNLDNKDNIPYTSYTEKSKQFFHNDYLDLGHVLKGDICEFNKYEQREIMLSRSIHKISFNQNYFNATTGPNSGYSYTPHFSVPIRVFSDYVETGDKDKVDLIPDYSFYSKYDDQWRWRDLYSHGFIDSDNNGLDIPFFNGCHYPYSNFNFLLSPMTKKITTHNTIIVQPLSDECE
jgi:hypothetical protein